MSAARTRSDVAHATIAISSSASAAANNTSLFVSDIKISHDFLVSVYSGTKVLQWIPDMR